MQNKVCSVLTSYWYLSSAKYHTVGSVPKSNQNIVETTAKSIPLTKGLIQSITNFPMER
jgi:hypothetical protein